MSYVTYFEPLINTTDDGPKVCYDESML